MQKLFSLAKIVGCLPAHFRRLGRVAHVCRLSIELCVGGNAAYLEVPPAVETAARNACGAAVVAAVALLSVLVS